MDEKSLYTHILNLSAPWQVKSLSLDEKAGSVTVLVGLTDNVPLTCHKMWEVLPGTRPPSP